MGCGLHAVGYGQWTGLRELAEISVFVSAIFVCMLHVRALAAG